MLVDALARKARAAADLAALAAGAAAGAAAAAAADAFKQLLQWEDALAPSRAAAHGRGALAHFARGGKDGPLLKYCAAALAEKGIPADLEAGLRAARAAALLRLGWGFVADHERARATLKGPTTHARF